MPQSLTEIFNLALGACGSSAFIADAEERSREAATCRLWYPLVRDNVQSAAPWPSVKANQRLARRGETTEVWSSLGPAPGYQYSYGTPSDLLVPYHLHSFASFSITVTDSERIVSTSEESPVLAYLRRNESVGLWDHGMTLATVYTLATHITRQLTGRDTTLQQNVQLTMKYVDEMRSQAANGEEARLESIPDYMQSRGFSNTVLPRYFYPLSSINFGGVV